MEENKIKILLDTDVGDDIDDALAIALGLSSKEVEFVGITTVFKNTNDRARIAKQLVKNNPYNIPVYAGHCGGVEIPTDPYSGYPNGIYDEDGKQHLCQFTDDLKSAEYAPENDSEGFNGEAAIDFIIDSCYKYGKELTVLAIGPLTNIGKVIKKDPDALNHAKRVVIMGGKFYDSEPEWNIICDVEAAAILFSGAVKNLECIGLDVTLKTQLTVAETEIASTYKGKAYSEYASRLVRIWCERNHSRPTLHDPLAFFYCMFPDIVTTEKMRVTVVTKGEARGVTMNISHWDNWRLNRVDPGFSRFAEVTVAKEVDRERFFAEFLKRVFDKK